MQLREISDIGSLAPQFFTEGSDHYFFKKGWNLFFICLIILHLSYTIKYCAYFISNTKNCKNSVIQSTCNGTPSAGHIEGDQTATIE